MFKIPTNYERFLDRENARARMGAKGLYLDPDDDRDEGEPVYTADELEELQAQEDAADLLRERDRRP